MNDRTHQDFFDALARLTPQEKLLLDAYAHRCIGGTPFTSAMDIINEVIVKILDGDRHWPRDIELAVFIAGCVRSVASNSRHRAERSNVSIDSLGENDHRSTPPQYEPVMSAEDAALLNERTALTRKAVRFAKATLGKDEQGLQVLEGMVAGLGPQDMCGAFGMDPLAVKAARQRVVNRLKIFGRRNPL